MPAIFHINHCVFFYFHLLISVHLLFLFYSRHHISFEFNDFEHLYFLRYSLWGALVGNRIWSKLKIKLNFRIFEPLKRFDANYLYIIYVFDMPLSKLSNEYFHVKWIIFSFSRDRHFTGCCFTKRLRYQAPSWKVRKVILHNTLDGRRVFGNTVDEKRKFDLTAAPETGDV